MSVRCFTSAALLASLCIAGDADAAGSALKIPAARPGPPRLITLEDEMARLTAGSLRVSPDGRRFAVFVRRADPADNRYRSAWFVGEARGGALVPLGDGGEIGARVMYTGHTPGEIEAQEARWSPDGAWIAYKLRRDGEVQLWRSRTDGSVQEQLTHNAADVREFAWSEDGQILYFSAGSPRADLRRQALAKAYSGYGYDDDLWMFSDFMAPQLIVPPETDLKVWAVVPGTEQERPANESERAAFERVQTRDAASPDPRIAQLATLAPLRDEKLRLCGPMGSRLLCVRENASTPDQVVTVDPASGRLQVLADLNPQFREFRLGKVERFEWDTPRFAWNEPGGELAGLYPARTYGYILYPPDFDPKKKYPVFIDPYVASGYGTLGNEHPLHVYAAHGIVVLRTNFPSFNDQAVKEGKSSMKKLYSDALGFPHLTMLSESTLRGLDTAIARGFIDPKRVGIGGVSHGSFVPLFMMRKHDRIAAISISSPSWGGMQYYQGTRKARDTIKAMRLSAYDDWVRNPQDEAGREFWRQLDIADNVDTLEGPVLLQLAAQETYSMIRFIRNLADAGKPYDAYIFNGESHIKWQPAHLRAIAQRNLDWFRFWLQDAEDGDPAKAAQYQKWRAMRE